MITAEEEFISKRYIEEINPLKVKEDNTKLFTTDILGINDFCLTGLTMV